MFTAKLEGAQELERALMRLARAPTKKAMRQVNKDAIKTTILPETKRRAPVASGLMRDSLTVRAGKRKSGQIFHHVTFKKSAVAKLRGTADVGSDASGGDSATQKKVYFYPAAVIYGFVGRDGKHHEGDNFMKKAAEAKAAAAFRKQHAGLWKVVRGEWAKK